MADFFANPAFLGTLLAVPAACALFLYVSVRRKQAMLLLAPVTRKGLLVRPRWRVWQAVLVVIALGLTALASAGPRWGLDPTQQLRRGRDVVLVLDLSRSMSAEQPSRTTLALNALRDLADTFESRGGNRVALVAFASRPKLLFPLTQDYDHLRHVLDQIEKGEIPRLSSDDAPSGTRAGAALQLAAASCVSQTGPRPALVLLSDGDDPADDDEWLQGVNAIAEAGLPIHTVGFGDPKQAATIPVGNDLLRYDGSIVRTTLNEARLRETSRRTGGQYVPAHRESLPLGTIVLHLLDAEPTQAAPAPASVPVPQLRYAWFLLPALMLLAITMAWGEGGRPAVKPSVPARKPTLRTPALALCLLACLGISAGNPPGIADLLRQGDDAYRRADFEAALRYYEQAEALTQDPGQVAFNKAAALYRLERYKEAVECYRRCLEDDSAPADRQARAFFDLGNATLRQAGDDAGQLAHAVKAYRAALHLAESDAPWRDGARNNLELALLRLAKARAATPPEKGQKPPPVQPKIDSKQPEGVGKKEVLVPVDPTKEFKKERSDNLPKGPKSKSLESGAVPEVLPDRDQVVPLSPDATRATLAAEMERIAAARRQQFHPVGPAQISRKDW